MKTQMEVEYSEILEVLAEKAAAAMEPVANKYELVSSNGYDLEVEEVPHTFQDGFIPLTNGGVTVTGFQTADHLLGTGLYNDLPADRQKQVLREQQDASTHAIETVRKKFAIELADLGDEELTYDRLDALGLTEIAENLYEVEDSYLSECAYMFRLQAFYYEPNDFDALNQQHTVSLMAIVNGESPYFRSKSQWESMEFVKFGFDTLEELASQLDQYLPNLIKFFG
jgi:hypothetical protein